MDDRDLIIYQNQQYRYDPETNSFLPLHTESTLWDRWGWIWVTLILMVLTLCVT